MKISAAGLALIREMEGLRVFAYQDQVGKWSIGYGHLLSEDEWASGKLCTGPVWRMGLSPQECDELLAHDVLIPEAAITSLVTAPLNQNQFDALGDFVYNEGVKHFQTSTLLRLLNTLIPPANYAAVVHELPNWTYAGGRELPALVNRRRREIALWQTPMEAAA